MYLPFIFFFLSLSGIIVMIGRELILIKNGQAIAVEHSHPFVADIQKIKHLIFKNSKKFGYAILFVTLKFFIKSSNFIKTKSIILIEKIKNKIKKKNNILNNETIEKKEVSGYLKVISEYRQKIKKIKHIIKEEEGIE
ncbi:hypothetical protein COX93_01835 [Candidatus Nomurabacteria bacterium CG_4_10_14_0_2_um_filter_30_12]|uniref:Uncharacterized protein n=2 Tax=Candidatus Nomuraibacteriota TaxID=1752729 RepID=A0A2J0MFQ5_9BACT|nr:MAG: hypothetical protein COU48_02110 [Candidatus Nomurabacteria bacterium CG10_big_fil_rev_8_21_14_0_10_03_31_7]PIZ87204.1 MAG: hypothetical protein COX93_01835 [Candidatus Nomurabacteria bacterium CG_4_10_14_0_2_um_filter_30_12]